MALITTRTAAVSSNTDGRFRVTASMDEHLVFLFYF